MYLHFFTSFLLQLQLRLKKNIMIRGKEARKEEKMPAEQWQKTRENMHMHPAHTLSRDGRSARSAAVAALAQQQTVTEWANVNVLRQIRLSASLDERSENGVVQVFEEEEQGKGRRR